MSVTKVCFRCDEAKPADEFYRHPRMADGRLGKCKPCTRSDVKEHRANNLEAIKAYDRRRGRESGSRGKPTREAVRRGSRRWARDNKHKKRAQGLLKRAVDSGRMTRPETCSECNGPGHIHGHHHDYSLPLDVTWLCAPCHTAEHVKLRGLDL